MTGAATTGGCIAFLVVVEVADCSEAILALKTAGQQSIKINQKSMIDESVQTISSHRW